MRKESDSAHYRPLGKHSLAWRIGIVLFFALGLSQLSLPDGWRIPTTEEASQPWRNNDVHQYLTVRADFDGDGAEDEARILVNKERRSAALFVLLGGVDSSRAILLDDLKDVGKLFYMGISLVKPGRYKTACGKGYWECETEEPHELFLKRPAIDYFAMESANSFFFWNSETKTFHRIWISD